MLDKFCLAFVVQRQVKVKVTVEVTVEIYFPRQPTKIIPSDLAIRKLCVYISWYSVHVILFFLVICIKIPQMYCNLRFTLLR